MILRGRGYQARRTGQARSCRCGHQASVTAASACPRMRGGRPVAARRARRAPPEGRGVAATPESDGRPCPFSAHGLVPVSVTHSRSMTPQLLPAIQPTGPDGGVPEVRP